MNNNHVELEETELGALWSKYEQKIRETLSRRCPHCHDVDDILQNTFVLFHKNHKTIQNRARVYQWLKNTAFNLARNHTKYTAVRRALSLDSTPKKFFIDPKHGPPDEAQAQHESIQNAKRTMKQLPDEQRRMIKLMASGATLKEIAKALGVHINTIQYRIKACRAKIKKCLGNDAA